MSHQELYKLQAASLVKLDRGALGVAMEQEIERAARDDNCRSAPS